jgi:DNA polymerase
MSRRPDPPAPAPRLPLEDAAVEFPSKEAVDECRRCPLWERATQGVAGEGSRHARLILVGEQPGDEEDRTGRPFVGPAGRLLRELLDDAGVDPREVYITNAVKHFSWEPRGKRRLHKTPAQREIEACHAWLEGEIEVIAPRVIVALGATALAALLGRKAKVGEARGQRLELPGGTRLVATFHPSAVLRVPDEARKQELMRQLRDDLAAAAKLARSLRA